MNLRAFNFKNNFGLIFYDSTSEYPGYLFFNYPSIISENKVDCRTIKINILEDSSSNSFYFHEHLKLTNNIYQGLIKIKIIDFSSFISSGVIIKSSNSELSSGNIINYDDQLIFEPSITGAIPGEYFLEFSLFVEEVESSTEIYGEYQENDFESIISFSHYSFNLIYVVKCHEKCSSCNQLGDATNYFCVKCMSSFPYNSGNGETCQDICNDYIYIDENGIIYCIENCNEGKFIYRKNQDEKYCLPSCEYNNKELYIDENANICYNDCSEATNGNIYLYLAQCKAHCPENYTHNENNVCIFVGVNNIKGITFSVITDNFRSTTIIKNEKSEIQISETSKSRNDIILPSYETNESSNELIITTDNLIRNSDDKLNECYINIDSLIDNYTKINKPLEIKELEQCSIIYYCYSTNINMDSLISINPNLIYIDFNKCKNSLIKEKIIEENSQLLIIGKQKLMSDLEYEIYRTNGTKIEDVSICENSKLEMSTPINNEEEIQIAISLYEQGYDIFNLTSSFYYDYCLSAYINDSDLTLSIRQNDIMPMNKSVCLDGCFYNGVNLTTKRISCLCDFDYYEKNISSKEKQIEEVEENFFSYILDMINYKIIICHKLLLNFKNYFNNYGFYTGIGILAIILIFSSIYICLGKNSIKIQYLHHAPKPIENNEILPPPIINNISNLYNKRNSKDTLIVKNSPNNKSQPRRKNNKVKAFNPKKNIIKSPSNLPNYYIRGGMQNINNKKRNTTKEINKFSINNNAHLYENSFEKIIKINKLIIIMKQILKMDKKMKILIIMK